MLQGSVRRNLAAGITGIAAFKDRAFMRVLEGEAAAVQALFARISRDPRHHHIIRLTSEPVRQRVFLTELLMAE